ncbi:MAG: tRNA pseudouridine(55) synthase TruB, partial [Pseudomonadota bacterium]|nr:tRNA pseudouridine(55) synthase TruB [Pseudomonadota bacterium]
MARRRKGMPIHGWVNFDKPEGMTSTAAVGKIRRLFNAQKAGHAGTLDPLAQGILPIALGEATKTVHFMMDSVKTYRFTVRWGLATPTDDREGDVMETSEHRPTDDDIEAVLGAFVGNISQVPPAFSAIKIDGRRAYNMARAGEAVEISARNVLIDRLSLVNRPNRDYAHFEVECGKGTYVRSLARDMAKKLG